jgi:hypothetical protein
VKSFLFLRLQLGIYFAYRSLKSQPVVQNNQQKIQVIFDYMKRYQEIIDDFPENINEQDFDLLNLKKKIMIS